MDREAELEAALRREWAAAHHRICGSWPHNERVRCVWEPPKELPDLAEALPELHADAPPRTPHY